MRDENGRAFNLKEAKKQYVTQRLGGGMISDEQIISVSASKIVGDAPSAGTLANGLTYNQDRQDLYFDGSKPMRMYIPTVDMTFDDTSGNAIANDTVTTKFNDVDRLVGNKADKSAIPTKTSQLNNDSGYQTRDAVISAISIALDPYITREIGDSVYVKAADLTTAINAAITAVLENYYTKSEADNKFELKAAPSA